MFLWDNAVAISLPSATAATSAVLTIPAADLADFEIGDKFYVSVDGDEAIEVELTDVTDAAAIAADFDAALTGVANATDNTGDVVITAVSTGTSSTITITSEPTAAVLTMDAATIESYLYDADGTGGTNYAPHWTTGSHISVWVDGENDGTDVTLSGVTTAAIASDINAVDGVTASASADTDTTVQIDVTNAEAADGVIFSGTIGLVSVTNLDISAVANGAALATAVQTAFRAADAGRTTISAAWSGDVLTITDTRGRTASGFVLTDSGGAVDASITISNGSQSTITVTSETAGATSAVRVEGFDEVFGEDGEELYSATGAAAVTGRDVEAFGIYVGTTGAIKVRFAGGADAGVTLPSVPVGFHPMHVTHVFTTGTTASNLFALGINGILETN